MIEGVLPGGRQGCHQGHGTASRSGSGGHSHHGGCAEHHCADHHRADHSCADHSCAGHHFTGHHCTHGHSGGEGCHACHAGTGSPKIPDYLENNIIRFIYLLRSEGVRIGSSEVIDAFNALNLVSLGERETVKAALKSTLAKRPADQELFERTFEYFFTSPEIRDGFREMRREKIRERQHSIREAEKTLTFRGESMDLSEKEKTVFSHMPEREKQRLQEFLEINESRQTLKKEYRPFLEALVKGRLQFWNKQLHRELKEDAVSPDIGDDELSAIRDAIAGNAMAGEGTAGKGRGGANILTEDMQYIARKDLPQATALIRRMARLLATRISRRYRYTSSRRSLDLRSTIRGSIQHGGVPFHLKYKSRRIRKPKLMLVCDVSGSMIRYTSFVLQFIYGLNTAVQRIESFVFSENLERITPYFLQGRDFDSTIARVVKESSEWGGGTSIDTALQSLLTRYREELTRNTIVIIVSDTRTIRHKEALQALNRLNGEVKEIIWLNTLPAEEWEKYSTVDSFKTLTTMFPCNTLADLERVMSRRFLSA